MFHILLSFQYNSFTFFHLELVNDCVSRKILHETKELINGTCVIHVWIPFKATILLTHPTVEYDDEHDYSNETDQKDGGCF